MRPARSSYTSGARRALTPSVSIAVAGSLTLLLSAAPAHAAEPVRSGDLRMPRAFAPLDAGRVVLTGPATAALRVPAATAAETYTVVRGDTVSAIAARHGLRTADVLALNGLESSSVIYPGQVLRLTAAPAVTTEPTVAPPTASGAYVVQAGDTISGIAQSHGVSIASLFAANALGWSSIIYPGQAIAIPGAAAPQAAPAPVPAPPAAAAPTQGAAYVVQAGDTISAIAQSHGVSVANVLGANGLEPSSIIYPGQSITIPSAATPVLASSTAPAASTVLDAEQIANAQIIIQVGRELGVSDQGIAIALGTAMQESWLRNLDWGDRDSLGLFQQRPSTGWGSADQVRDPFRSTRAFFGGPSDPNGYNTRGLLDIPGWQNLSYADAAQAVQISAYPDRYARWEQPAYAWLAAHG